MGSFLPLSVASASSLFSMPRDSFIGDHPEISYHPYHRESSMHNPYSPHTTSQPGNISPYRIPSPYRPYSIPTFYSHMDPGFALERFQLGRGAGRIYNMSYDDRRLQLALAMKIMEQNPNVTVDFVSFMHDPVNGSTYAERFAIFLTKIYSFYIKGVFPTFLLGQKRL